MSEIIQKITRLLTTPNMALAYSKWLFNRNLLRKAPEVTLTADAQIGGWISFSEYWSFWKGIVNAEKSLIKLQLLKKTNRPTIAVDIGANIGLFTIYLATIGYDKVYSFEPVPQTFERLKLNVANNTFTKELVLNCLAVGAEEGFVEFQIFDDSPAQNRLSNLKEEEGKETIKSLRIPVTTLDKYCLDNAINSIDFLKVDVEGMEPLVIQGANQMLKNKLVKMVLIEICPANLQLTGNSLENLYNSILCVGYRPHTLLPNGNVGCELNLEDLQKIAIANVVLIPTS